MLITCIIPLYKTKNEYLYETLSSVFSQDYEEIELIITDDGSDGFDKSSLENYIEKHKSDSITNYHIITHIKNVGTVRNMNDALRIANGEIIIPIAADDCLYDSHVITRIVDKFLYTGTDVLVCSRMKCGLVLADERRLMPHPGYVELISKSMDTPEKQYKKMAIGCIYEFASGSAMYYRLQFMKNRGYYDEKYTLWEDGPFLAQLTRESVHIEMCYEIISIKYRDGGISSSKKWSKIHEDYCNLIKWEFLEYPDRFGKAEYCLINQRYGLQKRMNALSLYTFIHFPLAFFNLIMIKTKKLYLRQKCKLGGRSSESIQT